MVLLEKPSEKVSKQIDMNAAIESRVQPNFHFSQSNISTAATCLAHCVSSDFAMGKGLASTLACHPQLLKMGKLL